MKLDPALLIASVTLARGASLDRVELVLDREVEELRNAPPPKAVLARARAQVRAWARYEQDGVTFQGILLSAGEGLGSWDFGEALLAKIENVRAEQIRAVARTYLVDDHRTVVRFHAQGSRREPAGPDRPRERRRPPVARLAVEPVHRVPRERPRRGRGGGLRPGRGRVHVAPAVERHAHDERGEARGPPRGDRGDARVPRGRGGPHVPGAVHARDGGGDRPHPRRVPRPPHVPGEGDRTRPRRTPE